MATTVIARQLPRSPVLQISGVVIASIAVALVAVAVLARPPDTSSLTPGDVIDEFIGLNARRQALLSRHCQAAIDQHRED
jgi:hypothetical protein